MPLKLALKQGGIEMEATIWVEGTGDQKFLADVIKTWFNITFDTKGNGKIKTYVHPLENPRFQIIQLDGIDNLFSDKIKSLFKTNRDNQIKNIVLVDTDGDLKERQSKIEQSRKILDEHFPCFLIPNDQKTGNLETLLENIINPENQPLFDCWQKYTACLEVIPHPDAEKNALTLPDNKAKIYAYLEALLGTSDAEKQKIKEEYRDYTNQNHWDLNHAYLEPLKTFLNKHLIVQPA